MAKKPDMDLGSSLTNQLELIIQSALEKKVTHDEICELIKNEVKKLPPYQITVTDGRTETTIDGYARPELKQVLQLAHNRLNILMVGPAGCGKTFIAKQAATAMGLRFSSISCSAGMSESHLTGWLLPRGEGGRFEYTQSPFVDIYENGGVFLFDEIDAADSNTMLFVNQALANGSFFLPQRYENPEVKKHKDCVIMGAANTYGTGGNITYAGRERLDESTLDRFRMGVVSVGYDGKLEESLVEKVIRDWGVSIRDKISSSKLMRVMSTRFMLDASTMLRAGLVLDQIKETYFHGWRDDEKKKVA